MTFPEYIITLYTYKTMYTLFTKIFHNIQYNITYFFIKIYNHLNHIIIHKMNVNLHPTIPQNQRINTFKGKNFRWGIL